MSADAETGAEMLARAIEGPVLPVSELNKLEGRKPLPPSHPLARLLERAPGNITMLVKTTAELRAMEAIRSLMLHEDADRITIKRKPTFTQRLRDVAGTAKARRGVEARVRG